MKGGDVRGPVWSLRSLRPGCGAGRSGPSAVAVGIRCAFGGVSPPAVSAAPAELTPSMCRTLAEVQQLITTMSQEIDVIAGA